MKRLGAFFVVLLPSLAAGQALSPQAVVDLTADPRFRSALDVAMKCSVQRVADYLNAGSTEPAEILSSAAIQVCFEKWKIAAAVEAKIAPEYGITLNSLEFLKINEESYYPGVRSAAVEFRLLAKRK